MTRSALMAACTHRLLAAAAAAATGQRQPASAAGQTMPLTAQPPRHRRSSKSVSAAQAGEFAHSRAGTKQCIQQCLPHVCMYMNAPQQIWAAQSCWGQSTHNIRPSRQALVARRLPPYVAPAALQVWGRWMAAPTPACHDLGPRLHLHAQLAYTKDMMAHLLCTYPC